MNTLLQLRRIVPTLVDLREILSTLPLVCISRQLAVFCIQSERTLRDDNAGKFLSNV